MRSRPSLTMLPSPNAQPTDTPRGPIMPAAPVNIVPDEYLTVPEAAPIMRCSISKVYMLCRERKISSIKFGRQRLLTRGDIADYMAKHKETADV